MWRVCLELKLDVVEVDRTWTVQDILDANEALDVWDDAQDQELEPPGSSDGGTIRFVVTSRGHKP